MERLPVDRSPTGPYNRGRGAAVGAAVAPHAFHLNGGEIGFDGGARSRDACRAPLTRKSDGTSVNCGQSVRSRCLIKQ